MNTTEHPQYITQLNAFHAWLGTHYLSTGVQLLWFRLIGLFNASGWNEWVQIDNLHLMCLIGVTTERTAIRARQNLIDAGLLAYEKGKRAQPGRYRLIWFAPYGREKDSKKDSKNDSVSDRENDSDPAENTAVAHTIYKRIDKDKDEIREITKGVPAELAEVFCAYAEMRKKMRKPLTDAAVKLALQMLDTLAPGRTDEQRSILEQSIINGWAGVYPLRNEKAPEVPASYDIEEFERRLLQGKVEYKRRE